MKLFEYQAKELFEEHEIPVPARSVISGENELDNALEKIGLPCVLKAQVLQGGRGKAGLVKLVTTKKEAQEHTQRILEVSNKKLMVESALSIEQEIYLSITVEPVSGQGLVMACADGGIDIEEIARTKPEKIIKEYVDLSLGLAAFQARNIMYGLGMDGSQLKEGSKILLKLYEIFRKYEANLVEINPLIITKEGKILAADGKFNLDDNALYKHNRFSITEEYYDNEIEYAAALCTQSSSITGWTR